MKPNKEAQNKYDELRQAIYDIQSTKWFEKIMKYFQDEQEKCDKKLDDIKEFSQIEIIPIIERRKVCREFISFLQTSTTKRK